MLKINGIKYEFDSFYSGDVRVDLEKYNIKPHTTNIVEYSQNSATESHKDLAVDQLVLACLINADIWHDFTFILDTLPFERNDKRIDSGKDKFAPMTLIPSGIADTLHIKSVVHGSNKEIYKRNKRDACIEQSLRFAINTIYVFPDSSAWSRYHMDPRQPYMVFLKERDENGVVIDDKVNIAFDKNIREGWKYEFHIVDDIISMGGSVIRVAKFIKKEFDDPTITAYFSKAESSAAKKHEDGETELFDLIDNISVNVFI